MRPSVQGHGLPLRSATKPVPAAIITFYVVLIARVAVSAVQIVYHLPSNSVQETLVAGSAMVEFAACLIMLIALFERKWWSVRIFRIYLGIVLPLSLFGLFRSALGHQRDGDETPWTQFAGAVVASVGLAALAWRLGFAKALRYFDLHSGGRFPPPIGSAGIPSQLTDPARSSVAGAGRPPRLP
jgi:hypothetical protein